MKSSGGPGGLEGPGVLEDLEGPECSGRRGGWEGQGCSEGLGGSEGLECQEGMQGQEGSGSPEDKAG